MLPYHRLYYHFVWATRNRLPLIGEGNQARIHGCIADKVRELGGRVVALNSVCDHVHLLAELPPTLAPTAFIGQVKGASPHLAARIASGTDYQGFGWQAEYRVITLSPGRLAGVSAYIQAQPEHHGAGRLMAGLEQW